MDKNRVSEYLNDINTLLEDFFFKPLISTAMERQGVDMGREIRYFMRDAPTYLEDDVFIRDGLAELVLFCSLLKQNVLPNIDEALLISPFGYNQLPMVEDEFLYRRMMSHVFKDNLLLLEGLVGRLIGEYPRGRASHLGRPESRRSSGIKEEGALARA